MTLCQVATDNPSTEPNPIAPGSVACRAAGRSSFRQEQLLPHLSQVGVARTSPSDRKLLRSPAQHPGQDSAEEVRDATAASRPYPFHRHTIGADADRPV